MARIRAKSEALKTDCMVQIGYLPLTMHWCVRFSAKMREREERDLIVFVLLRFARRRSLPNGLLPDQVYVGLFGTLAAAFGLKGVWRATA
jgi:hypothetical protein